MTADQRERIEAIIVWAKTVHPYSAAVVTTLLAEFDELLAASGEMSVILLAEREHPGHCAAMLADPLKRDGWDKAAKGWHNAIRRARGITS